VYNSTVIHSTPKVHCLINQGYILSKNIKRMKPLAQHIQESLAENKGELNEHITEKLKEEVPPQNEKPSGGTDGS